MKSDIVCYILGESKPSKETEKCLSRDILESTVHVRTVTGGAKLGNKIELAFLKRLMKKGSSWHDMYIENIPTEICNIVSASISKVKGF